MNVLSGKLLLSLLPPNTPFFRYELEARVERELVMQGGPEQVAATVEGLTDYEMSILRRIEMDGDRATVSEALKHCVTGGNVLVHYPSDGTARMFALSDYVVRRSFKGSLLDVVLREAIAWETLPEDVQKSLERMKPAADANGNTPDVTVWTHIQREDSRWFTVYQECMGKRIDGAGRYKEEDLPWQALRWLKVDGEDYGRGHIEDHQGDCEKLEILTRAVDQAIRAGAKVVYMVDPGSAASPRDLNKAQSGDFVYGRATDIAALQTQKQMDIGIAQQRLTDLERRVELAFLSNTAVQRKGERVTAEEIRFMRDELEQSLGGTFTVFSFDFQRSYLHIKEAQMRRRGEVPSLPRTAVRALVVGGFDSMGRNMDIQNLDDLVDFTVKTGGPQAVDAHFHVDELIRTRAGLRGMRIRGLLKTAEERQQDQQQQQMMALATRAAPQAVTAAGNLTEGSAQRMAEQQASNPAEEQQQ